VPTGRDNRVPCQKDIARSQTAEGVEGLQKRRVAANILNKQSRTADKGWYSSLWVGLGASNFSQQELHMLRNISQSLELGMVLRKETT
jgi:hypothetical protein